ncbi:hypothetical protein ACH40F_45115 [Streptomyces sp. NPDC020794]
MLAWYIDIAGNAMWPPMLELDDGDHLGVDLALDQLVGQFLC